MKTLPFFFIIFVICIIASAGYASLPPANANFAYCTYDNNGNRITKKENGVATTNDYYAAFGETVSIAGSATLKLRFPGQYYDAETNINYNHHRYYDPSLGRFTQPDPIGFRGGTNVFAYVGNNPVRWVDPSGLVNINYMPWSQIPNFPQMTPQQIIGQRFAADMNNPDGVYSVAAHGGWDKDGQPSMFDSMGKPLSPQDVGNAINSDTINHYPGEPVLLDSCHTGQGGDTSFAAQLSQLLDAPVIAPDNVEWDHYVHNPLIGPEAPLWVNTPTVGDTPSDNSGHFVQFNPNGTSANVSYPSR